MLTQHPLQKKILIDVQRRVLAGAGQQMYYGIKDIALRIPLDQIKFAAAFFNGNKAPVIGHIGQSQAMNVVLPEPVEPAMQTDTPYRLQDVRK